MFDFLKTPIDDYMIKYLLKYNQVQKRITTNSTNKIITCRVSKKLVSTRLKEITRNICLHINEIVMLLNSNSINYKGWALNSIVLIAPLKIYKSEFIFNVILGNHYVRNKNNFL